MSFVQLIDKGDKVMLGWKTHAQKKILYVNYVLHVPVI